MIGFQLSHIEIYGLLYLDDYMKAKLSLLSFWVFMAIFFNACSENAVSTNQPEQQPVATNQKKKEIEKEASPSRIILFFGNSLTAAYGIEMEEGFVQLIQSRVDSLGKNYRCVNAGLSGETTAGGKNRIDWILKNNKVDIFVLELGGNDGLRGIDPASSEKNLESIIEAVKAKNPKTKILLAGMEAPPNMGADYTQSFRSIYPALTKKYKLSLIPFLLDGVGGISSLNLKDGIHPNPEGQKIVAENVWKHLKYMVE